MNFIMSLGNSKRQHELLTFQNHKITSSDHNDISGFGVSVEA